MQVMNERCRNMGTVRPGPKKENESENEESSQANRHHAL